MQWIFWFATTFACGFYWFPLYNDETRLCNIIAYTEDKNIASDKREKLKRVLMEKNKDEQSAQLKGETEDKWMTFISELYYKNVV